MTACHDRNKKLTYMRIIPSGHPTPPCACNGARRGGMRGSTPFRTANHASGRQGSFMRAGGAKQNLETA